MKNLVGERGKYAYMDTTCLLLYIDTTYLLLHIFTKEKTLPFVEVGRLGGGDEEPDQGKG